MNQPSERARLAAAQVASMAANGVAGALSGLFGAALTGIVAAALFGAPSRAAAAWIGTLAAAYGVHLALCRRWRVERPDPMAGCRQFAAIGFVEGALWGGGIIAFAATGTLERELYLILMGAGVAGAIGLSFGAFIPAFFARFLPATLPYIAWALIGAHGAVALHRVLAAAVAVFVVSNTQLARGFNASFLAVHRARWREHDLAEALRIQKEAAEAATLAKSRFLAAASHDLRQPVHTLRFYVSALRGLPLDSDNETLLAKIEAGIGRIDALFAGMLDLHQIEAGGVAPVVAPFPLAPLLMAIGRDHAADAAARGLRLRVVPTSLWVITDRLLLERMIRNLLGNALRYTEEGGVLLGARRRQGRVAIEVWDTGPGIAAADQAAIFEEFHQVRRAGADRPEGTGLGLAIVRRLGELLGTPVALCSTPGKGSCFSVRVAGAEPER